MKKLTPSACQCTDHEITLKEVSWCAQAILDKILPEGIWDVGGTSIAHVDLFICLWTPGNYCCPRNFSLLNPNFKWILAVSWHVCIWWEGFNFDAWTEVERLLRKMLLKLASTMFPITLNPSMQFLVFILLSWRAGMHQEAFKRHVSIACWLWPLSNLGRNLDFKVLFALQDYVPFHCAHDLLMATCKQRTLCESPSAKSLTECHTRGIQGDFLVVTLT